VSNNFILNTGIYQKFTDGSENNHSISNTTVEAGDGKVNKYSAYFNGDTAKRLQVSLDSVPDKDSDFSWGGWMMKNTHNEVNYPIFMSFSLPYIACNGSTDKFRLSYNDGGQKQLYGTTIPVLDTWYHVMAIRSGNILSIYINGILENSVTIDECKFSGSTFDIYLYLV